MSAESEQTLKDAEAMHIHHRAYLRIEDKSLHLIPCDDIVARQCRRIHNLRKQIKGLERALAQARLLVHTLRERR
jgi:hypothetical protein